MIGFILQRIPVVLLLIFPLPLKKLTTTADPSNLTQCVLQTKDRGLNFGCSADFLAWVRLGYYGRTPSASQSQFCENPTSSTNDCIPDKSGDRRNMGADCNTYTNCQLYVKNYNDIVASCPSNNGGFPYGYVSYECLPRKQIDGSYINSINSYDSTVNRALYGKIYLLTSGYPYSLTNKNVQFQISVDVNTRVSIRLLDAYGRLLDATGPCAYTLYIYSAASTYREWCVNMTSWTIEDSTPFVYPATSLGSQNIDVVFTKANPSLDAEGAFWMLIEAVNVLDSSPGRNINVSSGTTFTPQVRPTTMTSTTTSTTTSPTTTTPTTTTPTTTTPTTTTTTTTTTMTPTTTTTTTAPMLSLATATSSTALLILQSWVIYGFLS